jgi:hypothetical protein
MLRSIDTLDGGLNTKCPEHPDSGIVIDFGAFPGRKVIKYPILLKTNPSDVVPGNRRAVELCFG